MERPPVVYIAGERQHAGKTVASLGLVSALSNVIDPRDIGYFKPVGQEMVELPSGEKIDKDIQIVQEFTDLQMPELGVLSPVRVVSGVTREFLQSDDPRRITAGFEAAIAQTLDSLKDKKLIIAEGTGHPGVGSVVGLSNARVANLLGARILYLVGGGIGRTLDELEVDLSYFSHHHSRVAGVLFNKVQPDKRQQMVDVLTEAAIQRMFPQWDPPLRVFGHLPEVMYLNNPSMHLIAQSFKGHRMIPCKGCQESWYRPCRKVKIFSQDYERFRPETRLRGRDIAVIGAGSRRRVKRLIEYDESLPEGDKLGGIILTCANDEMPDDVTTAYLREGSIPALAVPKDTAETDAVLYKCFSNTKLQPYDTAKHERIVDLFAQHFDIERFIAVMGL
jgi:dethiobiotin synthetase